MRLDIITAQKLEISREKAKKMIIMGLISVNGIVQNIPKFDVSDLDDITAERYLPEVSNEILPNFDIPLAIVFEDEHLLVINKQKGLIIHEGASENFHTLVNALVAKFGKDFLQIGSAFRPGIIHRLDKDTTGLMVVAKTDKSYEILSQMIQNRDFTRKYLAVCYETPRLKAGVIKVNIDVDPSDRTKRKAVQIGGREAITHYRVIDSKNKFSLIECKLETGRTHQIRVHLHYIGCPIIGDSTYKMRQFNSIKNFQSQLLHAYFLEFNHPITGKNLKFIEKDSFLKQIEMFNFSEI